MITENKKWTYDYFTKERLKVLDMWSTGKDADLEEAFNFHKNMPELKNAAVKVLKAKSEGKTCTCPSTGTDTIERHKELLLYQQNIGKADFATTYIDSLTRNCRFETAEVELKKALKSKNAQMNGFPIVIHGVQANREIINALNNPVIIFGPAPDLRLTIEIGLAGGHTGYSGGPLISFWNYTKDIPPEILIHNYQYINRLMGCYEENGIPILYCVSGAMPATSPPSIMLAPEIIEILIAAEQGVKHIQLNCWLQGNIAQDIAYVNSFQKLAREYLDRFGYTDVKTTTYSVSPTGRFPTDESKVYSLIAYYAMIGVLAKTQIIGSRTIDEAHHIPTKEGTGKSFICAKMMIDMLQAQNFSIDRNKQTETESYFIEREVKCILDKVFELGDGDVVRGTVKAIETGVLDQPYSTSQLVKAKVLGVKDSQGASRFYDFGNLPFDSEIKEFHLEKINEREKNIKKKVNYDTIINDLTAISNGAILPQYG